MAYMTKDGTGPYANKAGEYVANHHPGSPALRMTMCAPDGKMIHQSQQEADKWQRNWLFQFRRGRPRPTASDTTKQLESMGIVGLYLWTDSTRTCGGDVDVPTPPELLEPV